MALTRSNTDKMVAGVCGGLAIECGIDTNLVRGAFILLSLLGLSGGALYLVLWLVMPRETGGSALQDIINSNRR